MLIKELVKNIDFEKSSNGNTNREIYLSTKGKARSTLWVKCEAEKNRFSDFSWKMLKINQDIICEHCA